MTGNLDEALEELIVEALPGLFGGASPAVELEISSDLFEIDPASTDAAASEPRPDDRTDEFPFDPDNPAGPYTLSQPPYPGPRRVRLATDSGDRVALRESEVIWDEIDPRVFDEIVSIVDIQIGRLARRLADHNIELILSDGSRKFIAEKGYDPIYGARPLKRVIQQYIENPLSLEILKGNIAEETRVIAEVQGEQIVFQH